MNIIAIFKLCAIDVDVSYQVPTIVLKHLKSGKTKIDSFYNSYNTSKETDNLFPRDISRDLIKQLIRGEFKEKTSKFKSYLRSKAAFEASINPIERVNLACRSLELFLKYPYKKGYGNKSKYEAYRELANSTATRLIQNQRVNLVLNNYSDINWNLENNFTKFNEHKNSSAKSHAIKDILKRIKDQEINFPQKLWIKNLIEEINGLSKLPTSKIMEFQNFLYLSLIFSSFERNQQIHNKAKYNLKDVLLAEIVDSILSTKTKIISHQKKVI